MAYAIGRNIAYGTYAKNIGVENKSSRISLNLELVHRYNANVLKVYVNIDVRTVFSVISN